VSEHPKPPSSPTRSAPREPVQRWRLVIRREALEGDQLQREQQAAWEAALRASGLPVVGLDALPPKVRYAPGAPLAPSIRGEAELADLWLTARLPRAQVREALEVSMPAGHELCDLYDVWLGEAALPGQVVASVYRATVDVTVEGVGQLPALEAAVAAMLAAPSVSRERLRGDRSTPYDLRPFIEDLSIRSLEGATATLTMVLRHDPEKGIGRPDEVIAELGDRLGSPLRVSLVVRERLVLASERAAPRGATTGAKLRR
jgi:Uncharacterized protein conserved in bacteria (DUF2344)